MATYDDPKAEHQTLSTTTVDTVKLTQFWDHIEVANRDGDTALYVSQTDSTPTSAKAGTTYIGPGETKILRAAQNAGGVAGSTSAPCHTVYLVGNANPYSVEGLPR